MRQHQDRRPVPLPGHRGAAIQPPGSRLERIRREVYSSPVLQARFERLGRLYGPLDDGVRPRIRPDAPLDARGVTARAVPSTPAVQLKGKKGRRKKATPSGPSPSRSLEEISASDLTKTEKANEDSDDRFFVIAQENAKTRTPYEEVGHPQLFWRGDSRGPEEVFETGFTTANERDGTVKTGANRILWRKSQDDIVPASAVCLAKDVRGSAFFPLSGEATFYMYALMKSDVVNTFKAQTHREAEETGGDHELQAGRYAYDPAYNDMENASAVWQYREYAAHRVHPVELLAAFKVERTTFLPHTPGSEPAIAGIRFTMHLVQENAPRLRKADAKVFAKMLAQAKAVGEAYSTPYPRDNRTFLSYMGIVQPDEGFHPQTLLAASNHAGQIRQIDALPEGRVALD